jgi:cytosine/adenosine deaminase-related metal-dependent hydrolase
MLGLEERVGSLEVGKDADLVVLSGPPFRTATQVLETWIEGEKVFDRSDPEQRRFATGGYGVGVSRDEVGESP